MDHKLDNMVQVQDQDQNQDHHRCSLSLQDEDGAGVLSMLGSQTSPETSFTVKPQ